MESKHRLVIVEDCTILRQGLRSLLGVDSDYEVVGEAADGLDAIREVEKCAPDLVLLDLSMPKLNGISAMKEIKRLSPGTKILALTAHENE